ncbi:GTP pyrophosphokinase family protein [Chakrabartyella piscis]|uniref:GTP pyrophosphokinase n=1 Tax=Chakrabartyella piscis TaxID=2918914 RepID=UPI002958655C|nr:GTP pyrophosphokinase family protein [Chakrabartyella piscis]
MEFVSQKEEEFYGMYHPYLKLARRRVLDTLDIICEEEGHEIQHIYGRIKSPDSMCKKLDKLGVPQTPEMALTQVTDAVGIRVICNFLDDVFSIVNLITKHDGWKVVQEKDYITVPKQNGYRSYHMILEVPVRGRHIMVEIQIRTISQDAWASLEHQMKYKKEVPHQKLIQDELKRCADELASTDMSMATIRELLETGAV